MGIVASSPSSSHVPLSNCDDLHAIAEILKNKAINADIQEQKAKLAIRENQRLQNGVLQLVSGNKKNEAPVKKTTLNSSLGTKGPSPPPFGEGTKKPPSLGDDDDDASSLASSVIGSYITVPLEKKGTIQKPGALTQGELIKLAVKEAIIELEKSKHPPPPKVYNEKNPLYTIHTLNRVFNTYDHPCQETLNTTFNTLKKEYPSTNVFALSENIRLNKYEPNGYIYLTIRSENKKCSIEEFEKILLLKNYSEINHIDIIQGLLLSHISTLQSDNDISVKKDYRLIQKLSEIYNSLIKRLTSLKIQINN